MEQLSNFYAGQFTIAKNQEVPTTQNYTFENSPFSEGSNVVVIPMIQTRNGGNTPNLRIWEIDANGFKYHIDEIRGSKIELKDANGTTTLYDTLVPQGNPFHKEEVVAFIAFVC